MKKGAIIAVLALFALGCENPEAYQKIAHKWVCSSWINTPTGKDKCNNNVYFDFNRDKTYFSQLGSVADSGVYEIKSETLYVTPKGKMQFAVQITTLNNDSLVLLMNLAGEEEILTLKAKK